MKLTNICIASVVAICMGVAVQAEGQQPRVDDLQVFFCEFQSLTFFKSQGEWKWVGNDDFEVTYYEPISKWELYRSQYPGALIQISKNILASENTIGVWTLKSFNGDYYEEARCFDLENTVTDIMNLIGGQ